jgi:hypothetical protein
MNAFTMSRARSVCGPGVATPLVLAAFEQLILDLTAGSCVGLRELVLSRREHVVVERALHDEERDLDRIATYAIVASRFGAPVSEIALRSIGSSAVRFFAFSRTAPAKTWTCLD